MKFPPFGVLNIYYVHPIPKGLFDILDHLWQQRLSSFMFCKVYVIKSRLSRKSNFLKATKTKMGLDPIWDILSR